MSISAEKDNKAIMRQFWSVWEQGNINLLDDLLAPEYVNHTSRLLTCQVARKGSKRS